MIELGLICLVKRMIKSGLIPLSWLLEKLEDMDI